MTKSFAFSAPVPASMSFPSATPESKNSTSLFSFGPTGPLHQPTPDGKTFSPSANLEAASPPVSLGKFGPGGSQPQLAFGGAKTSASATAGPSKPVSFNFGAQSGFSFGASPTPSFSFGGKSAEDTPKISSAPFSFGSRPVDGGSIPASTGFSFGGIAPTSSAGNPAVSVDASEDSHDPTPEPGSPSKNLAETVGVGEEDEETVLEQRGKLYQLDEGKYAMRGRGQFKVKRAKAGEGGKRKRRLLMRTDGGGNVVLVRPLVGDFLRIQLTGLGS